MIETILAKFFGTAHDRQMKQLQPLVNEIASFEPKLQVLTDDQLKAKTPEFKARLAKGETLDQILAEAFAVCREAGRRAMGMRHYDVQMIGGIVLHRGGIAEMRTGEGKTYVATLPVYLNALSGKGVQVVSVNDYLVKRDAEWMGRLYNWLGLSVGIIVHGLNDDERRAAYGADITYATNNELGFDYLRDNMKFDLSDYVQREHNFAIVDECDSILVDEARTPLIISGPAEASTDKYYAVDKIIPSLVRDTHFTMEEKSKTASLTEEGIAKVESLLKLNNLFDPQHIEILHHVYQALKAHHLYRLDVEYMIKDGEIVIVDEFTGRLMPGRRWSDGLHQAIEAKEKVEVKNENQTLASITFQNYFRMYNKLSGMTGTAYTEAAEFKKIYKLDVVVIPTNKPIRRADHQDMVYKSETAKFRAITADLKEKHAKGQPILVGTASIEKSEVLSNFLKKEGIRHDVLNAKHHEREAEIIAQAGRRGTITIATNMAGRGTDIVLGGNAEIMAKKISEDENSPEYKEAYQKYKAQFDAEKKDVLEAGGLCIIGTERHESRRIDNQLRGRSGRQGDPGESKFYLSLEDNLLRIFNGDAVRKMMELLKVDENEPITAPMVTRAIEGAQKKVEGHNFDIRKHLLDYDDVMNQQRNVIYGMRREILKGNGVERTILDMLGEVTSDILDQFVPESAKNSDWNMEGLNNALNEQFGLKLSPEEMSTNSEVLVRNVTEKVKARFAQQKLIIGGFFEQFQKMILLQAIDQRWKEHLAVVDKLKEGISLRAYGQKDPLIEYKKEAFNQFEFLNRVIRGETIEKLMKIQVAAQGMEAALQNMMPEEQDLGDLDYQSPTDADAGAFRNVPQQEMTTNGPQKRRMTMGPRDPEGGDRPMNRADRRRMNKRK